MSGPLQKVLGALAAGATSRAEIARRTGLPRDVVEAAVEHLARTGRVQEACTTTALCPAGGCGGCPGSCGLVTPGRSPRGTRLSGAGGSSTVGA